MQIVSLVLVSHFELDASVQIVSLANVPVGQDLRPWNTFCTAQPTTLSHATLNDRGVGLRWGGGSGGGKKLWGCSQNLGKTVDFPSDFDSMTKDDTKISLSTPSPPLSHHWCVKPDTRVFQEALHRAEVKIQKASK